jgi:hypothetical protein
MGGPRRTDRNRSLEPDVRSAHHAAVAISTRERRRPVPVEVAGELSCRGRAVSGAACAQGRGQIRRDEAYRAPANRRATVIMVCREAWSATCVVEPRGLLPMDWSQCVS